MTTIIDLFKLTLLWLFQNLEFILITAIIFTAFAIGETRGYSQALNDLLPYLNQAEVSTP